MWWLDDLLHEISTVGFWALVLFFASMFLGYFLRTPEICSRPLVLRRTSLCFGIIGSFFVFFFLIPEDIELAFVSEIFLFVFLWGLNIGFEKRWIGKEFFSRNFLFQRKNDGDC